MELLLPILMEMNLKHHVHFLRRTKRAEFGLTEDNDRPHPANNLNECLQFEDITCIKWTAFSPDLNLIEHECDIQTIHQLLQVYWNSGDHDLLTGVLFTKATEVDTQYLFPFCGLYFIT
ncbi:hypothetical protein TNCV_4720691 [Trichonephila clavipes]|uniref:Uncharacterized protein n=1 Tax=Trichonephila clavipes TaxID=2585209 RepID=A0A8X6W6W3_TRICX|nr:hypothetical protein TNCV_4720691 [Trichonephila clavipes]